MLDGLTKRLNVTKARRDPDAWKVMIADVTE